MMYNITIAAKSTNPDSYCYYYFYLTDKHTGALRD